MSEAAVRAPVVSRLRVGQWFALAGVVVALVTAASVALGIVAIVNLADARNRVVDRIDPAATATQALVTSLVNQETGIRGYALTRNAANLDPFTVGKADEQRVLARLDQLTGQLGSPLLGADVAEVRRRAATWRTRYAEPVIVAVRAFDSTPRSVTSDAGKAQFDAVRSAQDKLQNDLAAARATARSDLASAASFLTIAFSIIAGLLVLTGVGSVIALRRIVSRPLSRLAAESRRVARGDFGHQVDAGGPRDIVGLGRDVESMRHRIVDELDALRDANTRLDQQALDLRRSNSELEQFAYVASHDLQEPLRKVASFTQLLQRRYEGQLDERADQYIHFAVDGAVRMQQLINDLLAFSRVGRVSGELTLVDAGEVVEHALANLGSLVDDSGGVVEVGPLPTVRAEVPLLAAVFQNLVGNALKFRGEAPPVVTVTAADDGPVWQFTVADNGIGIDPEYRERIFVIFQRLHAKEAYSGTGIGLALCRKIVEYHGGRIWLDTETAVGTTFHFTLPKPEEAPA